MNNFDFSDEILEQWLKTINVVFYQKIFSDKWFSQVFRGVEESFLVLQQTDFMLGAMGGIKRYSGRSPDEAHPHIFISEEMWQHREKILIASFEETNAPDELRKRWLKIDDAFKKKIVMKDSSECRPRYAIDEFIIVPKPFDN
ncbi:MAG: hypothetical protein ACOYL6_02005 [Bacteriovoracaceae bacterium]